MTEWRPIETAMTDAPHWFSAGEQKVPKTRFISAVLVWGPTWAGSGFETPWDKDVPDRWTGEHGVFIATTWEGAPCWTAENSGPEDYNQYVRPTHWMPLPEPPATP